MEYVNRNTDNWCTWYIRQNVMQTVKHIKSTEKNTKGAKSIMFKMLQKYIYFYLALFIFFSFFFHLFSSNLYFYKMGTLP